MQIVGWNFEKPITPWEKIAFISKHFISLDNYSIRIRTQMNDKNKQSQENKNSAILLIEQFFILHNYLQINPQFCLCQ